MACGGRVNVHELKHRDVAAPAPSTCGRRLRHLRSSPPLMVSGPAARSVPGEKDPPLGVGVEIRGPCRWCQGHRDVVQLPPRPALRRLQNEPGGRRAPSAPAHAKGWISCSWYGTSTVSTLRTPHSAFSNVNFSASSVWASRSFARSSSRCGGQRRSAWCSPSRQ